uniref:Ig-like domain-containing protein n=1 Tax=Myripristis murdjan TaxID=586833 RepID=A0A667YRU1_9TELE
SGHIQWLKEGRPLVSLPHLSITSQGYMKIQQLRPSDAGIYTCVAGQAQENFVLKVIGSKQKLSVPETGESWLLSDGQRKASQPDVASTGERFWELHISLNQYDNIVQRLLDLKGSILDEKEPDLTDSNEKNRSTMEDEETSELSSPLMLIADTHRLDEIIHNLSEGFGGPRGEQLIAQLLTELTMTQGENNESTLHPPEKAESSTQGPLLYKPNIKTHPTRLRGPMIIHRPRKVGVVSSSEVVVHVGMPVLLQRQVASWVFLHLCLGRVGLLSDGSLRILSPSKVDEGLYTCIARNRLGFTSLSSQLQITGKIQQTLVSNIRLSKLCFCSDIIEALMTSFNAFFTPLRLLWWNRWRVAPWSPCSASCGGGIQSRRVSCVRGSEEGVSEVESQRCVGTGRRPSDTRPCNLQPCARWATTPWGPCHGHCVGPSLATQHRHVYCQDTKASKVPHRMCSGLQRPSSLKNCSTEACALQWRVGPWTQCTATCGRHGFQSRQVTCAHRRTGKAVREHHCTWRPRPPSWQRCNVLSCGRVSGQHEVL